MGPSVTAVYLPRQLMALQRVVPLSSDTAGYERVSRAKGEREPPRINEFVETVGIVVLP